MRSRPLKVLHVLPSVAPAHGGPTVAGLSMVRALRNVGIDAQMVTSDDDVGGRLDVPTGQWIDHESVPVWFIPRVSSRQRTLIGFTFAPGFVPWLRDNIFRFDFVHIHTVFSFPANSAMRRAQRQEIPYAVRPLGQLCHWSLKQRSLVKRFFMAAGVRKNVNGAEFIHTTSEKEAEETRQMQFESEVIIEPHGTEIPPAHPGARQRLRDRLRVSGDEPIVVFLSRIHEVKGLDILLEACAQLRDVKFQLIIAGSGEQGMVEKLRGCAIALGLAERIHWIGFVEGKQKWEVLQGADLFVLPSRSESFGIAVVEALACGLPTIVSDQVPVGEDVSKNDFGAVVKLSPDTLAAALREWLTARERRLDVSERAVGFVRAKYSWDAVARRLVSRYQQAIQSRMKRKV